MSPGHRPFKEVSLTATGAQFFKDRFSNSRRRDENVPACSEVVTGSFKIPSNATGLSHVHNLYFVAYVDKIYVYEPQFPSQSIEQEPVLIIHTEPKPKSPEEQRLYRNYTGLGTRAINRLLVQLLGNEEVVAVVRDDGDVEAYYTQHICNAIEKRAYDEGALGIFSTDLKPFFHRSVGLSAWGLAIHSTARMIAVSANTHATTVFTFALTDGESDDEDDDVPDEDEIYYYGMRGVVPPNDRRKNDVRILAHSEGTQNLPDICFCNTGDDPAGRWLLTADLLGQVAAWDVHSLQLNQLVSTAFSPPIFQIPKGAMDGRNGVWGLLFLDPLSFRHTATVEEALGVSPDHTGVDLQKEKDNAIWDLGKTVDRITHVRRPFKDVGKPVEVKNGDYAHPLEVSHNRGHGLSVRHPIRMDTDLDRSDEAEEEEEEAEESDDEDRWDSDDSYDDNGYDSAEETHMTFHRRDGTTFQVEKPKPGARFGRGESMCGDLPCPVLQLSFKDIYLYQPATTNGKAWDHLPIPSTRRLFQQEVSVTFESGSYKFGRINMYAQIPSLGVVIIATQKGRVAVLSLTQTVTRMLDYEKAETQDPPLEKPRMEKRVYGYRVDHILPLSSQEEAGHRPKAGIHGIAVGPVQGTEQLEDGLKRWRLLVHYQDLSVLAYEIGKPTRDQLDLNLTAI